MNNSESAFDHKLSSRTYYTLLNHGIKTKEQVLECYVRGDLLKLRNFGKVSHNEVFDWLDKEIDSKLIKYTENQYIDAHRDWEPLDPYVIENNKKQVHLSSVTYFEHHIFFGFCW